MRISFFWDVTQRRMAARIDILGQHIGPFLKGQVPSSGVK